MAEREPEAEQIASTNAPSMPAKLTPWAEIRDKLLEGGPTWLVTMRANGLPHVVPVGAIWRDGVFYLTMGQNTVKGRNLDRDARCVITLTSKTFDIVTEGDAAKVHDADRLEHIAQEFAGQGWPAYVHDGVFDAPYHAATTGPGPYDVYEITPKLVHGYATGPGEGEQNVNRSTRYRF